MQLKLTCGACPEQYSLLDDNGIEIGYFRLRHGWFRAEDSSGQIVYETRELRSDGIFEGDERREHMIPAINAVLQAQSIDPQTTDQQSLAEQLLEGADQAIDDWAGEDWIDEY